VRVHENDSELGLAGADSDWEGFQRVVAAVGMDQAGSREGTILPIMSSS
jgi:hypothetical protein